ncbi:MAG: hypothetical protein GX575_13235 [Candidatus Anammoximicrobium sp.]|nr:hypothetical protein [Candidatus Anammoximicrobium sp.]
MACDQHLAALRAAAAKIVRFFAPLFGVWPARARGGVPQPAAACLVIALAAASVGAQTPPLIFNGQLRDEAVRAIPFQELDETAQAKLRSVVSRATIYRRLPAQTVDCDPDLHLFLVRYPEVVVNIWQLMGVTKVKVSRTGPLTFDASDGAGTVSRAELVYGTRNVQIFYAEGAYDGPLLQKPVTGACVLLLRSAYSERDGKPSVSDTLDVFARLDHLGAEIIVKTLYPAVAKAVDFNFTESVRFVGQVSHAAELNGPGMQRLASKMRNVQPETRDLFARHVELAYQRAVLRRGEPAVPLASSVTEHRVAPAAAVAAVETPSPDAGIELNVSSVLPDAPDAPGEPAEPREKPMFRR